MQKVADVCTTVLHAWKVSGVPQDFSFLQGENLSLRIFCVFWTEDEFLERVISLQHPLAPELAIPNVLLDALMMWR